MALRLRQSRSYRQQRERVRLVGRSFEFVSTKNGTVGIDRSRLCVSLLLVFRECPSCDSVGVCFLEKRMGGGTSVL